MCVYLILPIPNMTRQCMIEFLNFSFVEIHVAAYDFNEHDKPQQRFQKKRCSSHRVHFFLLEHAKAFN